MIVLVLCRSAAARVWRLGGSRVGRHDRAAPSAGGIGAMTMVPAAARHKSGDVQLLTAGTVHGNGSGARLLPEIISKRVDMLCDRRGGPSHDARAAALGSR